MRVNHSESLRTLRHIDMMLLQVLGRRSQTPGLKDSIKLLAAQPTLRIKPLAGIPATYHFIKIHIINDINATKVAII